MYAHAKTGFRLAGLFLAVFVLSACTASRVVEYKEVEIERAQTEIPAERLLDVGILIFDPGVADDAQIDAENFLFPDVRRAEARYMPYHLKSTLESTGHWGAVWVLPQHTNTVDLVVWGRVEESDGLNASVRIGVWDATGREWINRDFETQVARKSYSNYRDTTQDPYQSIYNEIANELLKVRNELNDADVRRIREVAEMRYAAGLVPDAYGSYLEETDPGVYKLQRLPADGDPMLARLRQVREREYLLMDTLNEYYAGFYYDLDKPYEDWRRISREETLTYEELKRSARMRQILGAVAVIGAIAYDGSSGSSANNAISALGIYAGVEAFRSGFELAQEAEIRKDTLIEAGESFDAEAAPLILDIEGQQVRLTGNAEEKFAEWRRMLQQIYQAETGFSTGSGMSSSGAVAN